VPDTVERGAVAIVLPQPGVDSAPARLFLRTLATQPSRFAPVVLGPPGDACGIDHRVVVSGWFARSSPRRYATAVAAMLRALRPTVIEVHDAPAVAALLGGLFRPVPVLLVLHADPCGRPGARDAAERTYLLAQATRVATLSDAVRDRLLHGVYPAMRQCTVLPVAQGPAAMADALDALRLDALGAWSRKLEPPI
jgi:hypothetical protein